MNLSLNCQFELTITSDLTIRSKMESESMVFGVPKPAYESFIFLTEARSVRIKHRKKMSEPVVVFTLQKVIINPGSALPVERITQMDMQIHKTKGYFHIASAGAEDRGVYFLVTQFSQILHQDDTSFTFGWEVNPVSHREVTIHPSNSADVTNIATLLMEMKGKLNKEGSDSTSNTGSDSGSNTESDGGGSSGTTGNGVLAGGKRSYPLD